MFSRVLRFGAGLAALTSLKECKKQFDSNPALWRWKLTEFAMESKKPVYCEQILKKSSKEAEIIQKMQKKIVKIFISNENSPDSMIFVGTGFFVTSKGHVVTAAHVLDKEKSFKKIFVENFDGDVICMKIKGANFDSDVMVLETYEKSFLTPDFIDIHQNFKTPKVEIGDTIFALTACQYATNTIFQKGMINQVEQRFPELETENGIKYSHYLQCSLRTLSGMSGSPLLNDHGEIIGLIVKKFEEFGLALPLWFVCAIVEDIMESNQWHPVRLGAVIRERDYVRKEKHQWEKPQGIIVESVKKDSIACTIGIQPGDTLLEINATPVNSLAELSEALAGKNAVTREQRHYPSITLLRKGEKLCLKMSLE